MARRKRAYLEDDLDSSEGSQEDDLDEEGFEDNDADARAERSLFENPYQHSKRRRVGGSDDDEDEGFGGRKGKREKRLHFTQAPSFVTSETRAMVEDAFEQEESEEGGEGDVSGGEEPLSKASVVVESPIRDSPDDETTMNFGKLGSATRDSASIRTSSRGGIGSRRAGIGTSTISEQTGQESQPTSTVEIESEISHSTSSSLPFRGGIGLSRSGLGASLGDTSIPSGFGAASRPPQRSFLRDGTGSATSSAPGTPKLSHEEKIHFTKLQGSFGAKLMAKMGWQAGTGLGTSGEGIVTPVETKLRPKQSMGLAFKGFKEKTAQSKAEAKRRGEIISEDEDDTTLRKRGIKGKVAGKPRSDAWRRPKKTKVKVEHQTYEQIIQNAGQEVQGSGIGKIYDATSGQMREVSSLAEIASSSWTPSTDMTRIPEVRHNLRLIIDVAKGDLDGLAREGKAIEERKKWVRTEDVKLRRKIEEEAEREFIARLQSVHLIVDEIKLQSQLSSNDHEPSLDAFEPHIQKLITEFRKEYDVYRLDEIIVAAIAPVVRRLLSTWQPLQEPTLLVNVFRRWKHALKFSTVEEEVELEVDVYGARTFKPKAQDLAMTPYESLMWNAWLPKVRSCINNDWSPLDADPAIHLYEAWSSILPPFVRDNMLDQLVIPKVQNKVAEWQPSAGGPALQAIIFPWLPHVGLRMEELLGEAKRKVKSVLRSWIVSNGIPEDLIPWKDVFGASDWNSMMLKYIVPKLGATLREEFRVNPRKQDMTPLEHVLSWRTVLRTSVFSQLLETEFFPKWLDVLYIWLIQPNANFEEVAQWYAFWKSTFPSEVLELSGVTHGFTRGLQLMNSAIELGPDVSAKLPRPHHNPMTTNGSRNGTPKVRPTPARATEVTFRSIVEEFAATHDLLFIPTGKAHEKSRLPLFRVSHSVDGKGGVLVFILDDAVWALEGDDYRAISLEEMVLRANRPR